MSELRDFFETRKNEVESFFDFLESLNIDVNIRIDLTFQENNEDKNISINKHQIDIFKSQAILMIYNLIEGTVNKGLEYIFDNIANVNLKHNEVDKEIRVIWLRYFKLHLDDNGRSRDRLNKFDDFITKSIEVDIKEFRKQEKNKNYFSGGSLDSKKIKEILKKFEIELNSFEDKLKEIKENRNFLAHGEKSFINVSESKSLDNIKENKDKTLNFLREYVSSIEDYVENEKYKRSS